MITKLCEIVRVCPSETMVVRWCSFTLAGAIHPDPEIEPVNQHQKTSVVGTIFFINQQLCRR
ncbi:MAG: hypothetical protein DKINENOH_04773 [bacterium]|nr:hypothetical protein [bacterium]